MDSFTGTQWQSAVNELTFEALRLDRKSRLAVTDFVNVKLALEGGKIGDVAIRKPTASEWTRYAEILRDELDEFIRQTSTARHRVEILHSPDSGFVSIEVIDNAAKTIPVSIRDASKDQSGDLSSARAALIEKRSQWLYFERTLTGYDGDRTYLLKPAQHMYWTATEAIRDAGGLIADAIAGGNA